MSETIYVSFGDSRRDPTYSPASEVYLVLADSDAEHNPCVGEGVEVSTPLLPTNLEELRAFARILGFSLNFDNEGQAILYTGIVDPERASKE